MKQGCHQCNVRAQATLHANVSGRWTCTRQTWRRPPWTGRGRAPPRCSSCPATWRRPTRSSPPRGAGCSAAGWPTMWAPAWRCVLLLPADLLLADGSANRPGTSLRYDACYRRSEPHVVPMVATPHAARRVCAGVQAMFLTHPANGSALAPALATTRAEPAVFDNGAAPSDPNADFDDGPGNTPQADVKLAPQLTCSSLFSHTCRCITIATLLQSMSMHLKLAHPRQ